MKNLSNSISTFLKEMEDKLKKEVSLPLWAILLLIFLSPIISLPIIYFTVIKNRGYRIF